MEYTLEALNGGIVLAPLVLDGVKWETQRKKSPGKLTFTALYDDNFLLENGNAVRFRVYENGQWNDVFYGYVFKMDSDKDGKVKVTCYDQLRYLKNKDTYVYKGLNAGGLLKRICADFNLKWGNVEDPGYVIPQRSESNKTLFDIMNNALDLTMTNTNQIYVMYDDFGKIALQNCENMKVNICIDADTAQNFDYSTSIDSDVYNKVKLVFENKDTGKRDVYIAKDSANMNKWGTLQYYDKLEDGENGAAKAEKLLKYYDREHRELQIKNAFGDVRVRGGCYVLVRLSVQGYWISNWMMVDKVTHEFKENEHNMTLTVIGGDFV